MHLSLFIARRSLSRQKGSFSSFIIRLSIVATALSVAVMVIALAFINGFKFQIREKLFSFWGHIHITEFTPNASNLIASNPIREDSGLIHLLSHLPHVKQIVPYALRPAIIQADHAMEGIKLKGIEPTYKLPLAVDFEGSFIGFPDSAYSKDIVLSRSTADRLNIRKGDQVLLYFLEPGATVPRIRKATVTGLYHTGMEEIDKEFALADIRLLQRINNWTSEDINGYQIDLDRPTLADSLSDFIFNSYLDAPLTTHTMRDIYPNIFDWLQLQDVNAEIILIIMAVVAIINLAVALLILIVEQARMTALLKALGMQERSIRRIFLFHATLIAGVGILVGNILGLSLCWLQLKTGFMKLSESTYYMSQVPVRINGWHVLLIDLSTLFVCVVCMWLPSLYIRRIQPARVLQFK